MGERWEATVDVSVSIVVNDPTVITRCTENHTDEGVPAGPGEKGWRDQLYQLETPEDVIEHLAYNAVVNGVDDVRRLDGWADCTENAVEITVNRSTYLSAHRVEEADRGSAGALVGPQPGGAPAARPVATGGGATPRRHRPDT